MISAKKNLCSWHRKLVFHLDQWGNGAWRSVRRLAFVLSCYPKAPALVHSITLLAFDVKPLHFAISHKPNSKIFCCIPCTWFLFKMVMIILFCNINGSTFGGGRGRREGGREGGGEAFAIHISLHDYIKSMFCHIWLMYCVFFKTGLKYENRQKWSYYSEWSIFNNLLKEGKKMKCCSEMHRSGFCNI